MVFAGKTARRAAAATTALSCSDPDSLEVCLAHDHPARPDVLQAGMRAKLNCNVMPPFRQTALPEGAVNDSGQLFEWASARVQMPSQLASRCPSWTTSMGAAPSLWRPLSRSSLLSTSTTLSVSRSFCVLERFSWGAFPLRKHMFNC